MKREKDNNDSQELSLTEIMLTFVRAAVLERDPDIPRIVEIDWDKLMDISADQGLIAWVWDGICRLPQEQQPPRQQRINWGLSAQDIWNRYAHQKDVLFDMVEVCRQNGIRLLLMKGLGLSELYPKPQSRPFGDIDIFLFGDFLRGNLLFSDNECLENELHTSFNYRGINVENHKVLIYDNSNVTGLVAKYLLRHEHDAEITASGYYILPPIPNLVYLLMHAMNHVRYISKFTLLPIKNILDLGMFILYYKEQLPSDSVYKTLKTLKLDKSFELVVYLSEWLLDIDLIEYHAGLIKRKDVDSIRDLLLKHGLSIQISNEQSFFKQTLALWNRYYKLKPIARYIPKKPKCGLFRVTSHRQIALFMRHLFNLSDEYTIKDGLKLKLKLRV